MLLWCIHYKSIPWSNRTNAHCSINPMEWQLKFKFRLRVSTICCHQNSQVIVEKLDFLLLFAGEIPYCQPLLQHMCFIGDILFTMGVFSCIAFEYRGLEKGVQSVIFVAIDEIYTKFYIKNHFELEKNRLSSFVTKFNSSLNFSQMHDF